MDASILNRSWKIFISLIIISSIAYGEIIYVKNGEMHEASGGWENAFTDLRSALIEARSNDEIWVAAGTYKPTTTTDQTFSFAMKDNVSIFGGFVGNETNLEQRNFIKNKTILSGNIGDPCNKIDNSYHIIVGANSALLDGFTVTGGSANGGSIYSHGSAMYNWECNPIIANCIFNENVGIYGGALYNIRCNISITNCSFNNNTGQKGGAIYNDGGEITVDNCSFNNNSSYLAGAIRIRQCHVTIFNSEFINNTATQNGGAMNNAYSHQSFINCLFVNNSARYGGAMYNDRCGSTSIFNCTISRNTANFNGGGIYETESINGVILNSCIIWDNFGVNGAQIYNHDSDISAVYSNIQDGWQGNYNIDLNPNFVDPNNGNYHLKSQAGHWNNNCWVLDDVTSPCIDSGDPNDFIDLEPSPNGNRINMGFYGKTEKASKSYCGDRYADEIAAIDINGDCMINMMDFAMMAMYWNETNGK